MRWCLVILSIPLFGQRTVLDGVFTGAQAERGAAVFAVTCSRCHGENLQGKSDPALVGNGFVDRWREDVLDVLFTHVRTRMPPRGAGQGATAGLPENTYLDLVSFILQSNGYPSGPKELTAEAAKDVLFVGKDGPKPLPTNSLVLSVGCMTAGPNNTWLLTNASEPVRVRIADESDPEELKRSAARKLGQGTLRLQNVTFFRPEFKPETVAGHKVQAKGVMIRQTNNDRINVLSLEAVGESCGP